ncbi:ParB/RepB/Spo0J family partition protein [candidate division KSB1 bacterium]
MCIEIPINEIIDDIVLIRKGKSDIDLDYLKQSINNYGLLCPIIVREIEDGYQLVSGRRRLTACRKLGYKTISAIVKKVTLNEAIEIAFQENVQRVSFGSLEEADIIDRIRMEKKMIDEDLCDTLGLSVNEVNLGKRLNDLPNKIKQAVLEGKLTERQALSLTRINDKEIQLKVFNELISNYYSVDETESLVSNILEENIDS